jgi:hypothetical protein
MVSETVPSHGLVWSSPRHRGNADGPVVLDVNLTTCKKEMLSQEFNTLILGSKTEIIAEPRMWLETTLYNLFQGGGCYIYIHISFSSYNIKVFPMYSKESAMTVESPFFGAVHHEHIRTLNLGECGRRPLRELRRTWMSNW